MPRRTRENLSLYNVQDLLDKTDPQSLDGTRKVLAVAIPCEEPGVTLFPTVQHLAGMLLDQYKRQG